MAKPGRPGITEDLVRVPSSAYPREVDEALRNLAREGRRPLSSEVRQALEEYVARENGKGMPEKMVPEPMTKSQAAAVARVLAQGDDIVDGEVFASALRRIFPEHEWRKLIADRENGKSK